MQKPITYEEIAELHKKSDGQCQKCKQKCDKKVVSFVTSQDSLLMVCPDCKESKDRPFFTPSEKFVNLVSKKCLWNKEETYQFLQVYPLGIALINHNANTREYWNWDKTKPIKKIETDHEGNYINVVFSSKKNIKRLKVDHEFYIIKAKISLNLKKMYIPDELIEVPNIDSKVGYRIKQFEEHGTFSNQIIVKHDLKSKSKPFTIIDGYSIYKACQNMGLRLASVVVVEQEKYSITD